MKAIQLNDDVVRFLITKQDLYSDFPFLESAKTRLSNLKVPASGCPTCRRKKYQEGLERIFETVRTSIRFLSSEKRDLIKKALNADSIRICLRDKDGPKTYTL